MDSIFGKPARLILIHPRVERPQELIVKGGEGIIVSRDGSIKYSMKSRITPVDINGCDLNKK